MEVKDYAASFFIGHTTRGLASAVFFDPSFAGFNNHPPVSVITGAPGSGKTFFAQTLCAQSAIAGKMTVVIDPKADFLSMISIEEDIGDVTLIRLSERSRRGIIDPFVMASEDRSHGILLAKELISILTGIPARELPIEAINPICTDVANSKNPSFSAVIRLMRGFHQDGSEQLSSQVRGIGTALNTIAQTPFGKLLFSNEYQKPPKISLSTGTTVITMLGVDLPTAAQPVEEHTDQNRIASSIMYLISDFASRAMMNDESSVPKLLIIDEAWSVIQNSAGKEMIQKVSLLGRSLNTSLLLITQSLDHLDGISIENTISTFFAFGTKGKEGNLITAYMGLREDNDDSTNPDWTELMSALQPGECLMKDLKGNFSTVQIARYKEDWARAFETSPLRKDPNKGKRRRKKPENAE